MAPCKALIALALATGANAFVARDNASLNKALLVRGGDLGQKWRETTSDAKQSLENTGNKLTGNAESAGNKASGEANKWGNKASGEANKWGSKAKSKGNELMPDHISLERAVPMAAAVPGVFLGLELLFNPSGAAKYVGLDGVLTSNLSGNERSLSTWAGLALLVANAATAATAYNGGHDNIKLANAMALATSVATEGVQQWTMKKKGLESMTQGYQGTFTVLRGIVVAASVWALASLAGNAGGAGSSWTQQ